MSVSKAPDLGILDCKGLQSETLLVRMITDFIERVVNK
jgi:hypothetical protein